MPESFVETPFPGDYPFFLMAERSPHPAAEDPSRAACSETHQRMRRQEAEDAIYLLHGVTPPPRRKSVSVSEEQQKPDACTPPVGSDPVPDYLSPEAQRAQVQRALENDGLYHHGFAPPPTT